MAVAEAAAQGGFGKAVVDARALGTREVNAQIKRLIALGEGEITITNPGAKHNLAVALLKPVSVRIEGSAGYYCGGLIDGARIEVTGSVGWGLGESMMNGTIVVRGSAGNGAAAAIRGGTVVIHGEASARLGVSMKGGTVLVAGDCGYMAGFMGQKGTLVVCGNAGDAFADSMYNTVCFVGGKISSLGNDAVISEPDSAECEMLANTLKKHDVPGPAPSAFKKVISGRRLWNFDKRDWRTWQEAL